MGGLWDYHTKVSPWVSYSGLLEEQHHAKGTSRHSGQQHGHGDTMTRATPKFHPKEYYFTCSSGQKGKSSHKLQCRLLTLFNHVQIDVICLFSPQQFSQLTTLTGRTKPEQKKRANKMPPPPPPQKNHRNDPVPSFQRSARESYGKVWRRQWDRTSVIAGVQWGYPPILSNDWFCYMTMTDWSR